MNIIYIVSILAIYILFILMHKTEKKQNIIKWLAISSILILCYNTLICLMLTLLNILCTLANLSICNFIIILILLGIILKNKKIQKYYFKMSDFIFAILLLIVVIFVAYKQYGFPFNIKYHITDGSTHYFFAQQFYENSTLLYNEITDDILGIYNAKFRLPGAYTNEGILFKVFDNIIAKTDLFVIFDLFILYMSGILFFYLLKTYAKDNKILSLLASIIAIIYMLGYQLNSMLYGYVYLSLALDIVITFLLLMTNYQKENISNTIALPILALVSFGMFFSYAYFIPIIYISIIVNLIVKSIQNKEKVLSTENISILMYLIVIPLILGFTYFILFPLVNGMQTEVSTIGVDGGIYKNYITNYLPFIPIFIIAIITLRKFKDKKQENNFPIIMFIITIIFAITLFIGKKMGIVSEYYFFKAYYIIWPISIYNVYMAIINIIEKSQRKLNIVTHIYTISYSIIIIVATIVLKKNIGINDIFKDNLEIIEKQEYILKNEEVKIIDREDIFSWKDMYILSSTGNGRMRWMSVLCNDQRIIIDGSTAFAFNIEEWLTKKEDKYYFAYYQDYMQFEDNKDFLDKNSDKYKIIYKDEYAFILERK